MFVIKRKEVPIEEDKLVKLLAKTGCKISDWEKVHKKIIS